MKPSIGRVVHYVSYGTPGGEFTSQCRAAVITEVVDTDKELVSLAVLNPSGLFFDQGLPYDEGQLPRDGELVNVAGERSYAGGSWHWPERVE